MANRMEELFQHWPEVFTLNMFSEFIPAPKDGEPISIPFLTKVPRPVAHLAFVIILVGSQLMQHIEVFVLNTYYPGPLCQQGDCNLREEAKEQPENQPSFQKFGLQIGGSSHGGSSVLLWNVRETPVHI